MMYNIVLIDPVKFLPLKCLGERIKIRTIQLFFFLMTSGKNMGNIFAYQLKSVWKTE